MFVVLVAMVLAVFGGAPAVRAEEEPAAEDIVVDVAVLRPAGLLVLAGGAAFFVISSPIAYLTKSEKIAAKKLVVEPYEYTFVRPLGAN
jgi:hypothetical protein